MNGKVALVTLVGGIAAGVLALFGVDVFGMTGTETVSAGVVLLGASEVVDRLG